MRFKTYLIYKLIGFLFVSSAFGIQAKEILRVSDSFLLAIARVESSDRQNAYNSGENAIGLYQIRAPYFKDAQEFNPDLNKYSHNDCFNLDVSKLVIEAYLNRYGRVYIIGKDYDCLAKLHNGGCGFKNKNKDGVAQNKLNIYSRKVLFQLKCIDREKLRL